MRKRQPPPPPPALLPHESRAASWPRPAHAPRKTPPCCAGLCRGVSGCAGSPGPSTPLSRDIGKHTTHAPLAEYEVRGMPARGASPTTLTQPAVGLGGACGCRLGNAGTCGPVVRPHHTKDLAMASRPVGSRMAAKRPAGSVARSRTRPPASPRNEGIFHATRPLPACDKWPSLRFVSSFSDERGRAGRGGVARSTRARHDTPGAPHPVCRLSS